MYTTTNAPLPYVEGYVQDLLSRQQAVANTPYTASPGTAMGANPYLTTGWEATANRAIQGSPVMSAANAASQSSLTGGFNYGAATNANANAANPYATMNNPYLQSSIDNAQGDLARNFNMVNKPGWDTRMARSGGYNSGVAETAGNDYGNLAQNMGRIGTDMRMGAYNQSAQLAENQTNRQFQSGESLAGRTDTMNNAYRNFVQNAIGQAPGLANQDYVDANALLNVGAQRQAFDQAGADQNYRWWQEAQQFPQNKLNDYRDTLGMGAKSGSTATQPSPSTASQVMGGGLTGLALYNMLFGGK
jgi:hypothetical protein